MKKVLKMIAALIISVVIALFALHASGQLHMIHGNYVETIFGALEPETPTPEPTPEPTVDPSGLQGALYYLNESRTAEHEYFFAETVSAETEQKIRNEVDALSEEGNDTGFILMDLNTGNSITYNTDSIFYPASTIKAHYAVSLVDALPDVLTSRYGEIANLLIYSDNDSYQDLADTFGMTYLQNWCENAGVDPEVGRDMYIDLTPMDEALLWAQNYYWFEENENGEELGELFETPAVTVIHQLADEDTVTRTKAGWIAGYDPADCETGDAGIVYEKDHPYLLVVLTDLPSDFDSLFPLTEALMNAHRELIGETE